MPIWALGAIFTYSLIAGPEGTEIFLLYPSGGPVVEVCLHAFDPETEVEVGTKCQTPSHPIGEVIIWKGMDLLQLSYLVAEARQRLPDGSIRSHWAYPFEHATP